MARLWLRRPRRATLVFVEAVLAVTAAAVAVQSVGGYLVAGVAVAVGVAGLARRRGRRLVDVLRDRWGDPADAPAGAGLLPDLHVAEVVDRGGLRLGVLGDGQGFACVLTVDLVTSRSWAFADVMEVLTADPARPAAVQLLVEQRAARPDADPDFAPARTYASLPVHGLPLWQRVLLVLRHEPVWAPETAAARGGGAAGARNALVAAAARTIARAARDGVRLRPADADEAAALLRELAEPPTGIALSVPLDTTPALGAVLHAAAGQDVARSVLSITANAVDHSVCAVLRLVDPDPAALAAASDRVAGSGLAEQLPHAQDAGLLATLPLGGGARSLAGLVARESR